MRQAVKIAEAALEATLPMIKIGVSEKEIASELFMQLIRQGSDTSLPFSPIVSGGPNGANPHAQPSMRQLVAGDLLVIDWGACCNGYMSDLTRTFAVGEIDAEAQKIHTIVQQANAAGRAAGKAGGNPVQRSIRPLERSLKRPVMASSLPTGPVTASAWSVMKNHICAVITNSCWRRG